MVKNKKKKIIFDEKTDSSINGFALVFAFIIIGLILQFDTSFFGDATNFIKIVFIFIGILGLFTEISNLNIKFGIKGLDNIGVGFILLVISYLFKNYLSADILPLFFPIVYQSFLFFLILISIYGFSRGIIEMLYSIYINYKEKSKENKKVKLFSSILIILTQLFGLMLIIAQIYEIFGK